MHSNCDPPSTAALPDLFALVAADLDRMNRGLLADLRPGNADVQGLVEHVGHYRGKQLRPALVFLWGRAAGGTTPAHDTVAKVVELIHLATLVHDDVLDGADRRRRMPTLNAVHGNEVPVLLGDYIYARAFHMSVCLDDLACSRLLADVTRLMCQGEITQIQHRFDFAWTQEQYFDVIREKTATLYGAACRLGAHYAGGSADLLAAADEYGEQLGVAFQIVDDCLDLDGDERVVGKSLGTDAAKGKLTLPLIWLMQKVPGAQQTLRMILEEHDPVRCLVRLRAELPLADGIAYAMRSAETRVERARTALEALPESPARETLSTLAEYVLRRDL